jgi:hypothetical protein
VGFAPHFGPSGAPPAGQNTETKTSFASQLTMPSACTDRTEALAGPASPLGPGAPCGPCGPWGPCCPCEPGTPCRPCAPCGPAGPCGPVSPFGPGSFPQAASVNAMPTTAAITIFFIRPPSSLFAGYSPSALKRRSDTLATEIACLARPCVGTARFSYPAQMALCPNIGCASDARHRSFGNAESILTTKRVERSGMSLAAVRSPVARGPTLFSRLRSSGVSWPPLFLLQPRSGAVGCSIFSVLPARRDVAAQ